jgi:hypothetical protein
MKLLSAAWCLLLFNLIAITIAEAEPIVFIVSYHNLDWAKNACEHVLSLAPDAQKTIRELANNPYGRPADWVYEIVNGANECKSVRDPRELGRRLENELIDALAVNTRCGGVTVIRDPHPDYDGGGPDSLLNNDKIKNQKDHWELFLDYNPGHKTYGWTLFSNKAGPLLGRTGPLVSGEGDTPKVSDQSCIVVTKRGATIR